MDWIRRFFNLNIVVAETAAGLMRLNICDFVQTRIFLDGAFEPKTLQLVQNLLRPGDCFVDVGANVGQYSLAAARRVGELGQVVAIEPNPEICTDLFYNRKLNQYEKIIRIVTVAASNEDHLINFSVPLAANRGMSRETTACEAATTDWYTVGGVRLSEILLALSIRCTAVVKIDVEGSELRVLQGLLDETRFDAPNHIVFEFVPESFSYGRSPAELIEFLEGWRYEILTITGLAYVPGESVPENNLWARRKRA